ncbi:YcaO-like family protein [Microbispora sp. NEAU-D428]|uniref:YcaO-like family protein n=1 Tax=Microbispora sitophila TaxID=2771537 RepID=UPI0018677707|nr:YcaO-like family protein [Microbispora sitophila]MBE3014824.1 YcaO-like family protein [Microbispora sitophila]
MERVVPLWDAMRRVTAALTQLGLTPELIDVGRGGDPSAWSCRLLTEEGASPPMAQGMGKGRREEARAGALFEALEHYLTGPDWFDPTSVELVESAHIVTGPLRREACSVLLARTPGARLGCCRYRALGGGREIPVPLFLWAPWYAETWAGSLRERAGDVCDYGQLMRYSCNSGSAVGVTAAEALLHALNETIERDALSLLLVRAFLCDADFRPTVIDPATLPHDLARAYSAAERLTGSPVYLLDITSGLNVPTMLAYTAPTSRRPHRRGAGTSLSASYAAWRALTELVQTTLGETLSGADAPVRDEPPRLADCPELHACWRFDLTDHLRDARTIPYSHAGGTPDHPSDQLSELISILSAHGYIPYWRLVAALPEEIVAVHAVVPGLERFMLIIDGNLVLPGQRGHDVVRKDAGAAALLGEPRTHQGKAVDRSCPPAWRGC